MTGALAAIPPESTSEPAAAPARVETQGAGIEEPISLAPQSKVVAASGLTDQDVGEEIVTA